MNLRKVIKYFIREFFPWYEIINVREHYLIGQKFRKGRKDFYSATSTGEEIFNFIKVHTNYHSNSNILDIGCGDGLLPNALVRNNYVGNYLGIEIIQDYVKELNKVYKHKKNFEFIYKNIYHSYYNDGHISFHSYKSAISLQKGFISSVFNKLSLKAKNNKKKEKDNTLIDPLKFSLKEFLPKDLFVFNSVFSHMKLNEIKHYLNECRILMNEDSEIYATFFIFDELYNEDDADENHKIREVYDKGWTSNPTNPEFTVIFKKETIEELVKELKLNIIKYVPGHWKMTRKSMDSHHQDLLILKKTNN